MSRECRQLPHCAACPAELPRLVKHVDDVFLRKVTQLYRQRLPEGQHPPTGLSLVLPMCSACSFKASRDAPAPSAVQLLESSLFSSGASYMPQPADGRACSDAGGAVLDLMSSWVSHLPEEMAFSRVVGHGMNAAEAGALPGHGFARPAKGLWPLGSSSASDMSIHAHDGRIFRPC